MSYVLSVYSKKAFKEFLLPSEDNTDYELVLHKNYFMLQSDMILQMDVIDHEWKIKQDSICYIQRNGKQYHEEILRDKDVLLIQTHDHEQISIIVKEKTSVFHSYKKYDLQNTDVIFIGKNKNHDIVYDFQNMVSKDHAVIRKTPGGYKLENVSLNGTYINSSRVNTEKELKFGDYINIMGLHMLFLDNIIAIDTVECDVLGFKIQKKYCFIGFHEPTQSWMRSQWK